MTDFEAIDAVNTFFLGVIMVIIGATGGAAAAEYDYHKFAKWWVAFWCAPVALKIWLSFVL